jgi:hypothetical protein
MTIADTPQAIAHRRRLFAHLGDDPELNPLLPFTVTLVSGSHSVTSDEPKAFTAIGKVIGHHLVNSLLDLVMQRKLQEAGDLAYLNGVSLAYQAPGDATPVYYVPVDPGSTVDCDSCQ